MNQHVHKRLWAARSAYVWTNRAHVARAQIMPFTTNKALRPAEVRTRAHRFVPMHCYVFTTPSLSSDIKFKTASLNGLENVLEDRHILVESSIRKFPSIILPFVL